MTKLALGSIIGCRFPEEEAPNSPGSKYRPTLVVAMRRDTKGKLHLTLAYITSNVATFDRRFELRIEEPDTLTSMGLKTASIVRLDRVATVPYTQDWLGDKLTIYGELPQHFERMVVEKYNRAKLDIGLRRNTRPLEEPETRATAVPTTSPVRTPQPGDGAQTTKKAAVDPTTVATSERFDPLKHPAFRNEPAIPRNHVRLYRAESAPDRHMRADWDLDAQRKNGHLEAEGRWYTASKEACLWYAAEAGAKLRIVCIDIPADTAGQYRVDRVADSIAGMKPATFSNDPETEFFLPRDICSNRQLLFSSAWAEPATAPSIAGTAPPNGVQARAARAASPVPWENDRHAESRAI